MPPQPQHRSTHAAPRALVSDATSMVARCPAIALRCAQRRVAAFMDRALAPTGLSLAQAALMAHVAAARDDTIGALVGRTGLDQSTLSRGLRALERAGLVEIAMVESDLRRRAVWLTETGARRLERAMPLWREAGARLDALLDRQALHAVVTAAGALAPAS